LGLYGGCFDPTDETSTKGNIVSIGLLFWVIMIIGLLFGIYTNRAAPLPWVSNSLVLWILLALLGWAVFGAAVHK
jgi:hypothetical protein